MKRLLLIALLLALAVGGCKSNNMNYIEISVLKSSRAPARATIWNAPDPDEKLGITLPVGSAWSLPASTDNVRVYSPEGTTIKIKEVWLATL